MNRVGFAFIFIFLSFFVSAESSEILKFSRENWNIAIESFAGTLPLDFEYLKNSLPDLISQELDTAEYHVLSRGEIDFYRSSIVDEAEKKIIGELSQNYTDRDKLIFEMSGSDTIFDEIDKKIALLKDDRLKLAFVDESLIKTAEILQISWIVNDDHENLLTGGVFRPAVTMKQFDLDFMISGTIREVEGYFVVDIYGYERSNNQKISIYSNVGSIDDIEEIAIGASNELRSILLGRPWSILLVETDDPDALIYADGDLIGVGSAELKTAFPGEVFLEAIGDDNSYWSREADLVALEINEFSGFLSQSDIGFLTLDSSPAEADVYIGARWVGETPLRLPRYRERNIWITMRSDGYYDKSFEVSGVSPENIFIEMIEEDLTELEIFELRKKEFYRSLGWFSLSIAVPTISGGISRNYWLQNEAYNAEHNKNLSETYYAKLSVEAYKNYKISLGVTLGSFGISGGLLANVFVKLSRYIKAAEALAE